MEADSTMTDIYVAVINTNNTESSLKTTMAARRNTVWKPQQAKIAQKTVSKASHSGNWIN